MAIKIRHFVLSGNRWKALMALEICVGSVLISVVEVHGLKTGSKTGVFTAQIAIKSYRSPYYHWLGVTLFCSFD